MALLFTDFSEYTAGLQPTGWEKPVANSATLTVVSSGGSNVLRIANPGTGGFGSAQARWIWSSAGNLSGAVGETLEMVVRFRKSHKTGEFSQWVATIRDALAATGFIIGAVGISADRLRTIVDGVATDAAFTWSALAWYRMRLRVSSTNRVQAKIWADAGVEPGVWMIDTTVVAMATSGHVGIAHAFPLNSAGYVEYDWMGVATAGATAPMSLPAAPSITVPADGNLLASPVTVSWTTVAEADAYRLEYSADGGETWGLVVAQAGTTYEWDTSALRGVTLLLRVRSQQSTLNSVWSASVEFTVNPWAACGDGGPATAWTACGEGPATAWTAC
jgi:hypothetical protein